MEQSPPQNRPGFFRRFFHWLFSWRTAARAVITFAVLATLLAAFYTEENWRGQRDCENYKNELKAKGESVDWSDYIPPPVPDDQNVFKAPKMTEWFVYQVPFTNELRRQLNFTNFVAFEERRQTNFVLDPKRWPFVFSNTMVAADYQTWFEQSAPILKMIRSALQRPYARIDGDYTKPFEAPIVDFVEIRILSQNLAASAECHFLLDQPARALEDLTLLHALDRMLEGKPNTLVSTMIEVTITGIYTDTIAEGLRLHAWHEPQIIELQRQLEQVDLPPLLVESLRSERAALLRIFESIESKERENILESIWGKPGFWKDFTHLGTYYTLAVFHLHGWLCQNLLYIARVQQSAFDAYDPATDRFLPQKTVKEMEEFTNRSRYNPYTILAAGVLPNFTRAIQTAAYNQTQVNEALIACALERYRLASGAYPESLDALAPQYLDKIPHDIIGGGPLHYHRTDADHFTLYSIGWNERDDGGMTAFTQNGAIDYTQGDWVWGEPAK